jgi:mannosyltransferase PIG-V
MGYGKENRKGTGVGFVLVVYAASRLFYLVAGALLARVVPVSRFQRVTSDVPSGTMNLWSHWDGEHYAALAANGYLQQPENVSPAFFPLYPLLVRCFAELFGGPVSKAALSLWGPLVSLLFLPLALYFVYRIAEDGWGEGVARGTTLALAFFPTAFFLNSAYTESLFLALSAGSVWAARVRKDLLLACVLAGFAGATRNVGVFLVAPLFVEWLRGARESGWDRGRLVEGGSLALVPAGLLAYMAYLWMRFGDPFLFYSAQELWDRRPVDPLTLTVDVFAEAYMSLGTALGQGTPADSALAGVIGRLHDPNDAYSLLFLLVTVALLLVGLRVLPLSLNFYTFLLFVSAVSFGKPATPLMGFSRYVLVAFPLFITLAVLLEGRPRATGVYLAFSAAASLVFCAFFVSWRFVA